MYDDKYFYYRIGFNIVFAIPLSMLMIYALSLMCVGVGFILPFLFISEHTSFGIIRVLLYGTLINIFLMLALWAMDKYDLFDDTIIYYAIVELLILTIIIIGNSQSWSW